jgi:hypothetical protein
MNYSVHWRQNIAKNIFFSILKLFSLLRTVSELKKKLKFIKRSF